MTGVHIWRNFFFSKRPATTIHLHHRPPPVTNTNHYGNTILSPVPSNFIAIMSTNNPGIVNHEALAKRYLLQGRELSNRYKELSGKYNRLVNKFKLLENEHSTLKKKSEADVEQHKNDLKSWNRWADDMESEFQIPLGIIKDKEAKIDALNNMIKELEYALSDADDRVEADKLVISDQASIIEELNGTIKGLQLAVAGGEASNGDKITKLKEAKDDAEDEIDKLRRRVKELEEENEYLADNALAKGLAADYFYRKNRRKARKTDEMGPWKMLKNPT